MKASPSDASELVEMGATALSRAIHAREVSCREVMHSYLAQIARHNPRVNAIVALRDHDALLQEADRCDAELSAGTSRGWMHGLPQAPKDIVAVAGMPTTMGSPLLAGSVPRTDSLIVARMRRAGAIFIGRSTTPEFGLGSHTYSVLHGITRNAFDPSLSAGGSSGGAAVCLALRMLPCADGSDVMGSLRNPAAFNHIVGFRPSWGRVPSVPAIDQFYSQLGTEGPMGRCVEDVARLLSTMAGYDARAPLSLAGDGAEFAAALARPAAGARIAWLADLGGHLAFEPGVLDLCRSALTAFIDQGHLVDEAQAEFDMARAWDAWLTLRSFQVAGRLRPYFDNPATRQAMKPEAQWEVERSLQLSAQEVFAASEVRTALAASLQSLFERFDFLALPSAQVFPFPAEETWPREIAGRSMDTYHRWMEVVILPSLAGLPAISVPAGRDTRGRPMGIQLIGRARADLEVLRLAFAYQEASGFTSIRSPQLLTE